MVLDLFSSVNENWLLKCVLLFCFISVAFFLIKELLD